MIEKLSVWKWSMHIHTPGWHTFYFITFVSLSVTWWCRWRSGRRCRRFWRRCGGSFAPPAGLRILCCTILAWKAAGRMIFVNHCRVSFHRSLHLLMPRKLNSSLLLFSDFGARFLNQLLRFLYCGARKPAFGHFRHIPGKAHVGLFQLYPTSLPRHSRRHVENLQEISCYFKIEASAITSNIYDSVASSTVFKACLVHSWGPLSRNSSAKIPELMTS